MNQTLALLAVSAAVSILPTTMYTTLGASKLPCNRILHGLWQTSGGWGEIKQQPAVDALATLSKAGFNTFDGADHYGPSETLLGLAKEALASGTPPTAFQAFTKWCPQPRAYSPAEVGAAMAKSLTRMRTPALDLLQLHWWDYGQRQELQGVLEALQALQAGADQL